MNDFGKYPIPETVPLMDDLTKLRLKQSASVAMQSSEVVMERAMLLTQYDTCRALLASNALRYTVALSFAAQQASSRMPQSAELFKAIVEAFAENAVKNVKEF